MLNANGERELAYIVRIDDIKPIEGRDRVECAVVGGWTVMVRKEQFKVGDPAVYFEIDSKLPAKEPYMFLEQKHFGIKTQKYKTPDGHFYSQGLLMSAEDFGWTLDGNCMVNGNTRMEIGTFLTKELEVTYYIPEDNARKSNGIDKYKKMAQRHPKVFKKPFIKWLMRRNWGKKLLFVFFGKPTDKKSDFPNWVVKTDEERIQNIPFILDDKSPWIVTEKIDGTSTTFTMKKKKDLIVCSRNVAFTKPGKTCFYDTNVYTEMAEKYDIENVIKRMFKEDFPNADWITIQGETYGGGIQKRDYSITEHDFRAFNLITSDKGRLNSEESAKILEKYGIKWVPIIQNDFILPNTVEELLEFATGKSVLDDGMREGYVFRSQDGTKSFKAVSNEFLIKYHAG